MEMENNGQPWMLRLATSNCAHSTLPGTDGGQHCPNSSYCLHHTEGDARPTELKQQFRSHSTRKQGRHSNLSYPEGHAYTPTEAQNAPNCTHEDGKLWDVQRSATLTAWSTRMWPGLWGTLTQVHRLHDCRYLFTYPTRGSTQSQQNLFLQSCFPTKNKIPYFNIEISRYYLN